MRLGSAHLTGVLLVAASLTGFSTASQAQETAALPYRVVYQQLQLLQGLDRFDKLQHGMSFFSTSDDVPPTDIRITLDDGAKHYEFTPAPDGSLDLPMRADWNEADLVLHTNQPRGSLSMRFGIAARPLAATQLRYRDLMEIRRQYEEAFADLARVANETAPHVVGLTLRFKPSGAAGLVILAAAGRQVHAADAEGVVQLTEEPALWAENPETVLDSVPEDVLPWLD